MRQWEELGDFIEKNCHQKEPYCLTAIYKCNLTQEGFDEEYMGLCAPGLMLNDPLYGQISYNSSLCNDFKLKLGHNVKVFLVQMKAATAKDIVEHVIRLAKVIPATPFMVSYAPLLIIILRLRGFPMKMKEYWRSRQVGKRLTVVIM